jgi:hypothetical protein
MDSFMRASRLEKSLDMKRVERERARVLEALAEKLGADERETLLAQTRRYEEGTLRYAELYEQLTILIKRHHVSMEKAAAFNDYLRYVAFSDKVDGEKLLDDIERLKAATLTALIRTPQEKRLVEKLTWLRLAKKLTAFSLTPAEWELYKHKRDASWAGRLAPFEWFYVHAEIRSRKIFDNVLRAGARNTVLITGGFHSPHIKHLLKKRGVSYTLVSPKMTTIEKDGGTGYLSVFTQEKAPIETVFTNEKLFINPSMLALGTAEGPSAPFLGDVSARRRGQVPLVKGPERPTLFQRLKNLFSTPSPQPFKLKKINRLTMEKLEERRYAAADLAVNLLPPIEESAYIQVAPAAVQPETQSDAQPETQPEDSAAVPSALLDLAFENLNNAPILADTSIMEEAFLSMYGTPDVLEAPVLAKDAAFEDDFTVDYGLQATPVEAVAPVEFDFTKVGALISPDVLHADEQGQRPVFGISILPQTYINTDPPVSDGYALLHTVDQGVTISRLVLDNALVEISLTPLSDVKTDAAPELALFPLQKQVGKGVPAPAQYAVTVKASQLSMNTYGEMTLRIASPFSEEELAALKDGSVVLTVRAILLDADGNVVLDAAGKEVAIALPVSINPGDQAAVVAIGPGTPDNVEFKRLENPSEQPQIPFFFLSPSTIETLHAPSRAPGAGGGGSGSSASRSSSGGGGGASSGGATVGGFAVGERQKEKPIPFTLSPIDLYEDIFNDLKRATEKDDDAAISDNEEMAGVDMGAIAGDGNIVSFEFENTSNEEVTYWVVIVTEKETIIHGPYAYNKEGDNYDFMVPDGAKIYFIVRDPGAKDGLSKVLPMRIGSSDRLSPKAPRVIEKEPQQSPGDVSEEDAPKKQSSNTALLVLPVAYIAAHDAIMKRIAQAKEVLKPRGSSSSSLVPSTPEPRPKKPETLPDIIPLKPLFEVSTFRQAVAPKDSEDILSQRIVTYVPKAQSEKELLWEIWGRYRTQNALSPNPHMEVFLTAANAQHAAALENVYRNMGDRIKIRRPADYDTLEKLRGIFVDAKLPGQIHFLIRQGAVVDENFLKMIYELSKVDGFIDRINVFFLVGATLQGEAGRLQSLDSLLDRRLFDLINSQA